ncbi:MAG: ATP-grasp domain-containing protein [Candidatus Omnitrophica bacterium]|nr:ATP-grasp domain-containing protein [Candidatus Omnitrophota bacterium]
MPAMVGERRRILVVGTTFDYIDELRTRAPGRLLFVTDTLERRRAGGHGLGPDEELLCPLDDADAVLTALLAHLERFAISIDGITCFDCESLSLTASLAAALALPFHSKDNIAQARSKYHSKACWRAGGVNCPEAALIHNTDELIRFWRTTGGDIVLKPVTGSGSEFVYRCTDEQSCASAFDILRTRLPEHPNRRMYAAQGLPGDGPSAVVGCAESFIGGVEYSCDAIISDGELRIVRLTQKRPFPHGDFGTVMSYQMLSSFPSRLPERELMVTLKAAARRLGFYNAWFMADLKVEKDQISMLELTPRPGGDCLPPLIKAASGLDVLKAMLDFAEGLRVSLPPLTAYKPLVGMQCYATAAGRIRKLDPSKLNRLPNVLDIHLTGRKGDIVRLPPEDYDSRKLGYIIFHPLEGVPVDKQCLEIGQGIELEWEDTDHASR